MKTTSNGDTVIVPEHYVDGIDTSIYYEDTFFPDEPVRIRSTDKIGYYNVLTVEIYPYRYNPVRNTIIHLQNGIFNITSETLPDPPTETLINQGTINRMSRLAASLVENYYY
jgi:hypothetical protein